MKISVDYFKQMIETVKKDRKKQIIAAGVVLLIIVLAVVSCGTKGEAKTASSGKAKAENGKNVKSEWQVYNKVDQFGDTTDETVLVLKNQKGTYSSVNEGSKDADLEWEMRVEEDGYIVDIILKEKGKNVSLSTLDDPQFDEYTISVKEDNGESHNFPAEVIRNSEIYNIIETTNGDWLKRFLAANKNPKIVISSNKGLGSYSLGTIPTEGFEELVFKKSLLDEADKLIVNGELKKAEKILEEYFDTEGFLYFMGFDKNEESYYTKIVGRFYSVIEEELDELFESGRYEDAEKKSKEYLRCFNNIFDDVSIRGRSLDKLLRYYRENFIDVIRMCALAIRKGLNEKCIEAHTFDGEGYYCSVCGFSRLVGDIGPAGGYIFYDCDADNGAGNEDGLISSECGWRFLEAAPEDLPEKYVWGDDGKLETQTGIGTGKANTEKISATRDGKITAAKACLDYSVNGYDDWFLPSEDELRCMYQNLDGNVISLFSDNGYWSSSEYSDVGCYGRFFVGNYRGDEVKVYRYDIAYVRPCRAF